jgi:hypothetical protein
VIERLRVSPSAVRRQVKRALEFAKASDPPPASLAKELEFPDKPDTDYNAKPAPADGASITKATVEPEALAACEAHVADLRSKAADGTISIGDALNLGVHAPPTLRTNASHHRVAPPRRTNASHYLSAPPLLSPRSSRRRTRC